MSTARSSLSKLAAIRMSILLAVLMFGAAAWYQRGQPEWVAPEGVRMRPLRIAGMVIWGVAVAGILTLRMKFDKEVEGGSNVRISIIAWALAELPALFGAVFYYITGDITLFAAGVGALVVSFLLFPVARRY